MIIDYDPLINSSINNVITPNTFRLTDYSYYKIDEESKQNIYAKEIISDIDENDIKRLKSSGRKLDLDKLFAIIEELKQSPTVGIGNPEPLKHNLSGFWSRRIN
jgi:Txe/YoeB family toxin of toxin-antitoxin system